MDNINWYKKSQEPGLTEDFIRNHQYKVDWDYISTYQVLSEDFIREFQDRVNWYCISYKQKKLSRDFILDFIDKLDIEALLEYQDLDPETREYLKLLKG